MAIWLKDAKSMLKIAQILRSPATISSFATCLQSVSLCFHPIHSHPGKKRKQLGYKSHPIFILGEITIFLYVQIIVHGGSTGIFHQRSQAINGPVRPSVWDLCRFCMTRPEPRPTTFISGQETLASVAYQGGSTWSMVGKQVETYCDLVILIGFKIMTCINIIYIIGFNGTRPQKMIATLVYCMVYIPTLVTWPQVTLKKVVPSTSNRSWTLGRQQLDTHTHKYLIKYRKVASRGCSLQPTCWYFNLFFPTSPCGVLIFGAASPASPFPPPHPSPPSVARPSAHHIVTIQIAITQTSRHPPYHASSHQQYHQDIITP